MVFRLGSGVLPATIAALFAANSNGDPPPAFLGIPTPPAPYVTFRAYGLSPDGHTVLGRGTTTSGLFAPMVWDATAGFQTLGAPGMFQNNIASGISDAGVIVGGWNNHAFQWTAEGGMQLLADQPGAADVAEARRIARDGSVVIGNTTPPAGLSEAARWTSPTTPIGLGTLNPGGTARQSVALAATPNASTVVGWSINPSIQREAMRWSATTGMVGLGDLSGGSFESLANSVSGDSSIIVGTSISSSGYEGFRWTASGGMVGLGDLPGGAFYSWAYAISEDGRTIVGQGTNELGDRAAYWSLDGVPRDLQTDLQSFGVSAVKLWSLKSAFAVSEDGFTIVGNGLDPFGNSRAWIATIPAPAVVGFLALGGVAFMRRARR